MKLKEKQSCLSARNRTCHGDVFLNAGMWEARQAWCLGDKAGYTGYHRGMSSVFQVCALTCLFLLSLAGTRQSSWMWGLTKVQSRAVRACWQSQGAALGRRRKISPSQVKGKGKGWGRGGQQVGLVLNRRVGWVASILNSAGFCCLLWWAELAATPSPVAHLRGACRLTSATLRYQSPRGPAWLRELCSPPGVSAFFFFFPVTSELIKSGQTLKGGTRQGSVCCFALLLEMVSGALCSPCVLKEK